MIDSIFVATSGMRGHERALSVISNNVSNMNTPGFRGSSVSFTDVFFGAQNSLSAGRAAGRQTAGGGGLNASRTFLDLRPGDASQTDRPLDASIDGDGFFVLQEENGDIRYTRAGRFELNSEDELVALGTNRKVMRRDAGGQLIPMSIADLRVSAARATTEVTLEGILSTGSTGGGSGGGNGERRINSVVVFDALGGKHTLSLNFALNTTTPDAGALVDWNVTVSENDVEIGSGVLEFIGPVPSLGSSPLMLTLMLEGTEPAEIAFNFEDVTPQSAQSTMSVAKQNGFATGTRISEAFDETGMLKLTYSNGQTADGPRLVLARITDEGGLVEHGDALFEYRGSQPVDLREAADDLKVRGESLELSNVDLTQQFSELILMQRGYQASSQVISTANDMLQELLQMRGGR